MSTTEKKYSILLFEGKRHKIEIPTEVFQQSKLVYEYANRKEVDIEAYFVEYAKLKFSYVCIARKIFGNEHIDMFGFLIHTDEILGNHIGENIVDVCELKIT